MAARGGEPRTAHPEDRALRAHRRLEGRTRADRRYVRTRQGVSSSVGSPIIVEGRVWGIWRRTPPRGRPPERHRGAPRPIRGARCHGGSEQRGPGRGGAADGGAGRPAAGGNAGRAGRPFGRPLQRRHRGGRHAAGDGPGGDDPVRGRRNGHCRGHLGRGRSRVGGRRRVAAHRRRRSGADDLEDGPAGTHRRLRRLCRAHRGFDPGGARDLLLGRQPDRRRGTVVGRADRALDARRAGAR